MKIIEIREESHNKMLKDAKKAEMLICELVDYLTEQYEKYKYDKFDEPEYRNDMEDEEFEYRGNMRSMRGGYRSQRRSGRYSY